MIYLFKLPYLLFLIFNISAVIAHDSKPTLDALVDIHWLNENLDNPQVIVIDASVVVSFDEAGQFNMISGKEQYQEGHIPHAIFADLMGDLSAKDNNRHFVMPSPAQFRNAINDLGISNDSQVVIYSKTSSQGWPQRLWWMLYWAGHDNIAVLDGGFSAWQQAGLPVSNKTIKRIKSNYKLNIRDHVIADRDEVFKAIDDKDTTIIDVLPANNYNGQTSTYKRPGHITSAINIPTQSLVTETGHYKTNDELKSLFSSQPKNRIITYCGGGIAASSTAFSLHRLGYKDVAVYIGSLQEWAANDENPMSVSHTK